MDTQTTTVPDILETLTAGIQVGAGPENLVAQVGVIRVGAPDAPVVQAAAIQAAATRAMGKP